MSISFQTGKVGARLMLAIHAIKAEDIGEAVYDLCVSLGVPPPQPHWSANMQTLYTVAAVVMRTAEPDPAAARPKIVTMHGLPIEHVGGELPGA